MAMATNWLRTGAASSSSNVGDQGEGGVKRSATGEKVVPNVEALVDVGGMRGEEKPVVEGLEDQMEVVLLRLLSKHGHLLRAAESAGSANNKLLYVKDGGARVPDRTGWGCYPCFQASSQQSEFRG